MTCELPTTRPLILAHRGVVTSGHYLASAAGLRILHEGGNAIDAAAAMCFCLNLLEPHMNGIGGEAPTLIYSAQERRAFAICGLGWSPKSLTIDWCKQNGIDLIPGDGYLPACVPAVVDTWAVALARFGTMSFTQVLQPAIELAERGFPVYENLHQFLAVSRADLERYPTTMRLYYPDEQIPRVGQTLRNVDLSEVLKRMCLAEQDKNSKSRVAGIEAGRDVFYRGPIAQRMVSFAAKHPVLDATGCEHTGLLSDDDLAEWHATVEEPVTLRYRGLDVHKCSSWTQGPVFLQQLAVLEGFDLASMKHNSAQYLHTWIESAKLAFADREAHYGDPILDDVRLDKLLDKQYAQDRRALIGEAASMTMRPGDAGRGVPEYACTFDVRANNRQAMGLSQVHQMSSRSGNPFDGDTTHLDAVDGHGNMVASTPSGGWIGSSPVIEGLGFPLGTRGQMFYLNPHRPNALAPRKRPRATLTPSLVMRDGKPFMVFGTPGGDGQDQITLQFFLNHVDFGMNIQQALEAPVVQIKHFPSSFYPREAQPGLVNIEARVPREVRTELERRGHRLEVTGAWAPHSKAMAIQFDADQGLILGGVSPRRTIGYAMGW